MNKFLIVPATAILFFGCGPSQPRDIAMLEKAKRAEARDKFAEAQELYLQAAGMGSAEAYKCLGDAVFLQKYNKLLPQNASDYLHGYDSYVDAAEKALSEADTFYEKAQFAGFPVEGLESSRKNLDLAKAKLGETRKKVAAAKEEARRKEEERKREEERKAELKRLEEERKKEAARQAELRRQEEERRKAEEARRQAEEAARRESADYCIDNGLLLTDKAFREVVQAVNYSSNTGNKLYDAEKDKEEHARFAGKRLVIKGRVSKVESTFFTDEVKIIISCSGGTISARFDGMSKYDASNIRVGSSIHMSGYVSNRPVLSSIAMDRCVIEE